LQNPYLSHPPPLFDIMVCTSARVTESLETRRSTFVYCSTWKSHDVHVEYPVRHRKIHRRGRSSQTDKFDIRFTLRLPVTHSLLIRVAFPLCIVIWSVQKATDLRASPSPSDSRLVNKTRTRTFVGSDLPTPRSSSNSIQVRPPDGNTTGP
jgi:hypothetical protein